jgi:hypothetical protein
MEMIVLSGTLQKGTRSTQTVLRCELGVFAITNTRLDDLYPGDYEGMFEIERLILGSLPYRDGGTIEFGIIADLRRFSFFDIKRDRRKAAEEERNRKKFSQWQVISYVKEKVTAESSASDTEENIATEDFTSDSESTVFESLTDTNENFIEEKVPLQTELSLVSGIKSVPEITAADIALFGERFELSTTIQLDATESREKLRQQGDRLKQLGYCFNAQEQVWKKDE